MNVGIIGLGYVGFAIAEACVNSKLQVVGLDISQEKLEVVKDTLNSKNFSAASVYSAIKNCEIVIICVPTPLNDNHEPDLSILNDVVSKLKPFINPSMLVINESTSYPGTLRNLIANKLENKCEFASAPERVDPSNEKWGIKNTPRLVSGLTPNATKRALEFYSKICDKVIEVSSPEVAEAAKLLENSFRQVNIALVNEFAQIAEKFGISANETIKAAATKPFGFMPFIPGIGVGGHCIPVDPSYLSYAVEELGGSADFIDLANKVNLEMPKYVAKRIEKDLNGLKGKKIQIAGIAYKPEVSDLRESPALLLIDELRNLGAQVSWCDPLVKNWSSEESFDLKTDIDLGLIVTPHSAIDFGIWKQGQVKVFDLSATSKDFGWAKYL